MDRSSGIGILAGMVRFKSGSAWRRWLCVGWLLAAGIPAKADACFVCDGGTSELVYLITDKVTGDTRQVCKLCGLLPTSCFFCSLPVKNRFVTLDDGRMMCARDAVGVVTEESEAARVCRDAFHEVGRTFSRFTPFPGTNLTLTIVDRIHMDMLVAGPGFDRQCPSVYGYIRSKKREAGGWEHPIQVLGGLPAGWLTAIAAHELAHAWVRENTADDRRLDRDAEEGFCEYVAYKVVEASNLTTDCNRILGNQYTRGQVQLFLAADRDLGPFPIFEWMKSGVDARLSEEDPDRVRALRFASPPQNAGTLPVFPQQREPTRRLESLSLGAITGTGRRLAIINDVAFAAGDSAKVRLGTNTVSVKCLEVRTNSVSIQVAGAEVPTELVLTAKP